jgi:hypothetical protein
MVEKSCYKTIERRMGRRLLSLQFTPQLYWIINNSHKMSKYIQLQKKMIEHIIILKHGSILNL